MAKMIEELTHLRNRLQNLAEHKRRADTDPRENTDMVSEGSTRKVLFTSAEKLTSIIAALEASGTNLKERLERIKVAVERGRNYEAVPMLESLIADFANHAPTTPTQGAKEA